MRWNMVFGVANSAENCTISWFIYFYKNGSRSEVSNGKAVNVELKKYMKETCLEYCMVICQISQGWNRGMRRNCGPVVESSSRLPGWETSSLVHATPPSLIRYKEIWSGKLLDLFSSLCSTNSIKVFYAKGGKKPLHPIKVQM